jgi:ArsR family transcriptional regulator
MTSPAPAALFKCLGDETRLRTLLLLQAEGELCVCEIAEALALSQPKISRHLASLRGCGLLRDTRHGQWIYYQLHPELPGWIMDVLGTTAGAHPQPLGEDRQRLLRMGDRPERQINCC